MADGLPTSRTELIDWCLRKLGAPVIRINVDEDQVEDRISEALAYFRDYHFDGVEKVLLKRQITASTLVFAAPITGTFIRNEIVEGQTSGARSAVVDQADDNLSIRIYHTAGTFLPGETVLGTETGATGVISLAPNSIVLGDIDNQSIPVDDSIIGVVNILPFQQGLGNSGSIFDINYQFALNSMHSLVSTDIITFDMFKRQMALLQFEFHGMKGFRFNRKTDKVYLDIDWKNNVLLPDQYVVLICYKAVDPLAYQEVYGDLFVREFAMNLIKQQWGQNMKKFGNIALPGNVTLNGQQLYDEASQALEKLEERIKREWQEPPDFLFG